MMRRLSGTDPALDRLLSHFCQQGPAEAQILPTVSAILDGVRRRGDAALLEYTHRYDRHSLPADALEVPHSALQAALNAIPAQLRGTLELAADRILRHHQRQRMESWQYRDQQGAVLGERILPLERVGVYVPGGKAAYPSSVLMNVLPARVAGVPEVVMVSPAPGGVSNPLVQAAAAIAGVDRFFCIGGAQAVAALAYGTETIPRVDKITGPGNVYVALAKRLVFGVVGIDMIAGPSEVLVICDEGANPKWVAADLLAQAEHDEEARAILVSPCGQQLDRVAAVMEELLPQLPRAAIIRASLERNGLLIDVQNLEQAVAVANRVAPEHLQLAVAEPESLLDRVRNAGAIFLGYHSAEVLGDYCAGPNHVLPTGTTARFSSPLGVYDFQKRSSLIQCGPDAADALGQTAAALADSEGLQAHALSAELRVRSGQRED